MRPAFRTRRTCASARRQLSRKRTVGGIPARAESVGVFGPVLRQTQLERQGPGRAMGEQHRRHGDQTLRDLAEYAALLPLDRDRVRSLLREAGLVQGENPCTGRHDLTQAARDPIRDPRGVRDEMLSAS